MDVRERIDELRKSRDWSRTVLARKLGISYISLKNWYNEKNYMPSLRTIDDVCSLFEITKAQLFYDGEVDETDEGQIILNETYKKLSPNNRKILVKIAKDLLDE